jgi:hypothetical protein
LTFQKIKDKIMDADKARKVTTFIHRKITACICREGKQAMDDDKMAKVREDIAKEFPEIFDVEKPPSISDVCNQAEDILMETEGTPEWKGEQWIIELDEVKKKYPYDNIERGDAIREVNAKWEKEFGMGIDEESTMK